VDRALVRRKRRRYQCGSCRKRHIDEKLIAALGDIDAVADLGAGFDTRAYRLPALGSIPVWRSTNLRISRSSGRGCNDGLGRSSSCHLMPVDLDRQDAGAVLTSHGYTTTARTFFIWEGVTQYP
jgi:methyltransferase (TIGR00027 family)